MTSANKSKHFIFLVIAAVSIAFAGCDETTPELEDVHMQDVGNEETPQDKTPTDTDTDKDKDKDAKCTAKTCKEIDVACGPASDGCGNEIYCGTCELGLACVHGQCVKPTDCVPKTCKDLGASCGDADDGCGGKLSCGTCDGDLTCKDGKCVDAAGCTPKTCEELSIACGDTDNGCGGTINCGTCNDNLICHDGQCVDPSTLCTSKTCEELNIACGKADDGCGKELECGGCEENQTCTEGVCVDNCTPKTCKDLGATCGNADDGCGTMVNCGTCNDKQECKEGKCVDTVPMGTITEGGPVICRRSPQNRNMMGESCHNKNTSASGCFHDLVNSDHTSGLSGGTEPAQKVKDVKAGDSFRLLAKVNKNKSEGSQAWYQVKIDGKPCFLPESRLKTNGIDVPKYEWCTGSTINYTQGDPRWATHPYLGDKSISSDGCGPTSLANVITALTGKKEVTPPLVGDKYMSSSGGVMDRFCSIASSYGLKCKGYDTQCGNIAGAQTLGHCKGKNEPADTHKLEKEVLVNTLKAGGYVLCMHVGKYWTNNGHWITVYGYDKENNNIFADDPMNRKYTQNLDLFLQWNNLMVAITPK
ncbi:MAG: C39 family peptidase [Proteobacteria bacterium]|nr:C39 family peptidase [Pseudomonadota bacterium]